MAFLGSSVEYALHSLLWLTDPQGALPSSRDLAIVQGLPAAFMAKIFPRLEKAGIVVASVGVRGGYRLGRPAHAITVLDVVDAVEGSKPLFDCQEIRGRCVLFGGDPPAWSADGVCAIHAVMLRAEKAMRDELARTTLDTLARGLARKRPPEFAGVIGDWFAERAAARSPGRAADASAPSPGVRRRR